jgi:hypothetical protein
VGLEGLDFIKQPDEKSALVKATIKNFGLVAADNCHFRWDVFFNGKLQPNLDIDEPPNTMILFPGLRGNLKGTTQGIVCDHILSGELRLEVVIYITYETAETKYSYDEKHRYEPSLNAFMNLGQISKKEESKTAEKYA